MLGVPWPDSIVPAETVQLYVTAGPPLMFAVNVIVSPGFVTPAGPVTEPVGQLQATTQSHAATVTVRVWVWPQSPQPSSTPAVIVYVPGCNPLRSHETFAPVPTILPPETV